VNLPILQTKLIIPPVHPYLVSRAKLVDKIESGIDLGNKLTLVAAPAGFGKSTVASVWASQTSMRVAWLSLDEDDNEPTDFFAHFIASVQDVVPGFGRDLLVSLSETPPISRNHFLVNLVNEIMELAQPICMVLDDFHLIENPQIHQGMSFILDNQPNLLHLIIATRADPPLPISRLRAQRAITEIRAADLRFSNHEAEEFLNEVMKLELSLDEVHLLETRTEGWVVGFL